MAAISFVIVQTLGRLLKKYRRTAEPLECEDLFLHTQQVASILLHTFLVFKLKVANLAFDWSHVKQINPA